MKVKKSRVYTQDDGSKVSFTFDRADGKIVGIKKDGASVSPNTSEFADFSQGDDALAAYNVAKFGNAKVSLPGGCAIGSRPVNLSLIHI